MKDCYVERGCAYNFASHPINTDTSNYKLYACRVSLTAIKIIFWLNCVDEGRSRKIVPFHLTSAWEDRMPPTTGAITMPAKIWTNITSPIVNGKGVTTNWCSPKLISKACSNLWRSINWKFQNHYIFFWHKIMGLEKKNQLMQNLLRSLGHKTEDQLQ